MRLQVTLSHDHVPWWKTVEGSGRNDVISCVIYIVALRQTHGYSG